jgi:uncharacterized protein YndB with AHSA1/START domain
MTDPTPNRPDVASVTRVVDAPAQAVWDVLADGWAYATWVVGASRVRDVELGWPSVGTRIHHSFGLWPLVVNDTTEVLAGEEPSRLVLRARGWPAGEAEVVITVTERPDGSSTVAISEDAVKGPGTLVPGPLRQVAIGPRNVEALRRLAFLAEGRHRERTS